MRWCRSIPGNIYFLFCFPRTVSLELEQVDIHAAALSLGFSTLPYWPPCRMGYILHAREDGNRLFFNGNGWRVSTENILGRTGDGMPGGSLLGTGDFSAVCGTGNGVTELPLDGVVDLPC